MTDYWKRRNEEMKHIQSMFQTDADYKKGLDKIYNNAQTNIQKEIDAELMRYAGRENLSMDEAMKKITKFDVESFKNKAEKYVQEKNFSPQANDQLKTYNVKMRMNRAELLNQQIQLETIALADAENKLLTARLDNEAHQEYRRQAGILGESVPSPEQLNRVSKAIVESDFKGTNFSNRVWVNQSELQKGLEQTIQRTLIQGKHPREGARDLRRLVGDRFKNSKYAADRIAITESARVQDSIQEKAYEEFGVEEYEWIAESGACDECGSYDGEIFKVGDASAPRVPIHPFCRCSRAAYVDRKAWEKEFDERVTAEPEETTGMNREIGGYETLEEMKVHFKEEYNIPINSTLARIPEPLLRESLTAFEEVAKEFPVLREHVTDIQTKSVGMMSTNGRTINFNPSYFRSEEQIKDMLAMNSEDRMLHQNSSVGSLMAHELGHVLNRVAIENKGYSAKEATADWNSRTTAKEIVDKATSSILGDDVDDFKKMTKLKRGLSIYGDANDAETIAESFGDVFANGEKSSILSKTIVSIMKKEYL